MKIQKKYVIGKITPEVEKRIVRVAKQYVCDELSEDEIKGIYWYYSIEEFNLFVKMVEHFSPTLNLNAGK